MAKQIEFIDAQEQHKKHPSTFDVPSHKELSKLKKGDIVKVCVGGERFWTIIKSISKNETETITATVNNDLICTDEHGLNCDDTIKFEKKHIYSIY